MPAAPSPTASAAPAASAATAAPARPAPATGPTPFDDGSLAVVAWTEGAPDPGFDPRSDYGERFWTPVLGPSTLLLHRHLVDRLEVDPDGTLIDLAETALRLGLGDRSTRNGPFARSLVRLERFRQARSLRPGVVAIRLQLPPVSPRVLSRLPRGLQVEHAVVAEARGLVASGAGWSAAATR